MKGLRGLWGRMIPVVAFLVLFAGVVTANAYTISGTVTNNTGNTGSRVYLSVKYQFGGDTGFGVSIPTPGPNASAPYAIRGVPDGSYVINAFLDSRSNTSATRHSNDPFGSSQQVSVFGGNVSGVNITLTSAGSALQAPQLKGVVPGPGAALIMWDTPKDGNGYELAYAYNVYWGSSANIDATNPATYTGMATVAAHNDGMFIQTKISGATPLADLTTLYYAVYGTRNNGANLSGRSNVVGPVTIGAIPTVHPSTFTVSGTVTIDSGITPITGPLLVAVHSDNNGVYLAKIDNPGLTNNFTVTGVPNGSYEVFSLIDQNKDGLIWAGDYTVGDRNATMITVNGADMSAPTSAITKKDVEASVSTSHSLDASGEESFSLRFNVRQAFQLPVNVAVQGGQDVSGPVDLALSGDKGEFSHGVNNIARPNVGTQYTLDLEYDHGAGNQTTLASVPVAITAVLDSFPEPIAPKGKVTFNATPNFSWAPPASPPASFSYSLNLNGNNFWWNTNDPMPSSQTSAPFNFDGNAQGALSDNASYTWSIAVYDPNGNQASKTATFFSGGSISGKVTEGTLTGPGIPGISVQLYDGTGNSMPWTYNTTTATNGSFTVGGLQAGTYRVCFSTGQTGYIARCYDTVSYDTFNATNIPVTAQTDTPNINVALAKAATITGTVTANGGGAIQGVSVELRDSNGNWVNGQNQVQTDGNGAYTLSSIQTGVSFKLYFNGAAKGYIGQWYNGASDQEGAESITLNAGQNFTADATLVQGASITGTVTNSVIHASIQGINVQLYDQNGSWIWTNSNITTGADGTYTIGGLVSGTYKVCFNSGSTNYIGKCYDNLVNEPSNATSIQLTAPEAKTGIDAALVQGGTISGRVTNGTSGIPWVNVQLRGPDGNWVSGAPGTSTQPDGNYTLRGVPTGSYKIFFDGTNTSYVGKWYNVTGAVADQAGATTLTIDTGDVKSNIDAVLPQGGSISGTVTDIDTTSPISGINVQLFDNSGQPLPNSPSAMTGGNGSYNIGGLPDGNYKVCFYSGSTSYMGKCYNQLALDPANATSIQIDLAVNGGNVTGKNASLKLGATITGLVTNGSTPIPDINVQLQNPDGSWVQSGVTDANGNYAIRAIPAGDYRVFFDTFNTNYVRQWYNGKSSLNSADQIILVNGGSMNGVNAVLALAGTITGKVINDSSLPIPGSPVQLWDTNNNPIDFKNTDQNGNYTFGGLAAGNYKVQFQNSGPYFGEWYNDKPSFVLADAVAVTAGQITALADTVLSTRQPTTTILTSTGPNPSIYGNSVSFTATVNQPGASGIVRFLVDGAEFASSSLVGGNASATIQNIPAGTHTVTAAYVGDVTNMGSTSNQLIQTVNTATLTVTADAKTKGYGTADPNLTYAYDGIVNGDPPSIFTGSLTRVAGESVGDYAIQQGSLSAGNNYQINFTGANLTITTAALTVTANNASRAYGAANPSFTVSHTGFITGETVANLGGTLSVTTPAVQGSAPGSYAITPSGLTSANYNITFINGALTINKAMLTVTADSQTKAYGSVNPPLTYAITGFTNGENLATSGVSGVPALSTTAVTGSNVGTYPITVSPGGLTAVNYDFTLVNGTLSVTKATATLTLSNLTQTVGSTQPVTVTTSPGALSVVTVTYTGISGTTYGPSTTAPSALGIYSVVASLSNANYQAVDATGTLAINAKPTPVINWSNPQDIIYGTALSSFQVNATALDPVTSVPILGTYTYTPAGGTVLNAGNGQTLSVTFTPNDTNAYNGATKTVTLNVLTRALTVTADAKTKVYGVADPALTYQITSGSLAAGDSITGALTRAAGENVGTHAIQQGTVSAGANYTITYAGANLTITKAALSITADAKSKVYGTADPALTYTVSGLVNGDTVAIVTGTPVRAIGEDVGTYVINPGTLSASSNYTVGYTTANLTITKAALTLIATSASKTYGAALPVLAYTITGFVNGDTQAVVSGWPNETTVATASSNVGAYPITITTGALSAVNYTITNFVDGTLTVTPATLTINADAQTKVYGSPELALTYSQSGLVNGDTTTVITGALSRVAGENVGTYALNQGTLSAGNNYNTVYTGNNLVITKATLTIMANTQTKLYGATDPTLTYSHSGLTNGDTIAVITGALTRVAGETVGTYAINQGDLATGNYTITYTGANLTITKATATVTLGTLNFTYDGAAKATTATTTPAGLTVAITYAGSATAPTSAGGYAVVATVNDTNYQGAASGTLNIAKANQTTTFGALANKNTGDPAFNLTATASSGLPVSYTSSNTAVATVSGNTVTIVGFGTTNITASQGGDGNWDPATNVVQSLAVKTGQTITFGALTGVTYGDAPFTLGGTASSGLTVSYASSDPTVASISGNTVTILKAGSVTITANQAGDATYNPAAAVGQTLTVNKAALTITANTQTKVYGAVDPALTYVPSGLTNSDTAAVITGALARATGETVGSYAINQGDLATGNYTITYTGANLTITKATATVTLGTLNFTYDGAAKATTATSTPAGLTVAITYAGSATAPTSAGSYAVVATVNDTNYQGAASGTLNIARANQTTTFGALANKNTGDPAFNLTATASSGLPVSYTSSNTAVATVSGNTVTIVGFGTTNITASQAGDGNWNAATNVVQALTVKTGQTITFGALSGVTYGDAPFTLGGTTSSGLTVSYTSYDPTVASISGNTVTILKAGSVTITANQAGDATYNPAPAVTQTLTVNKATATLIFDSASLAQTYNGSPRVVTVTTSPAGLTGVTFTYDGSATVPTNVGSYAVKASLSNPNYQANDTNGTLIVTKATPVVTWANPADITYGTPLGATQLNATANTAGAFSYTPASGTVLNAGNQALSVSFIPTDTANFNATPVTKSVTINVLKATPVITWSNPADLAFGTPLSATQLNATASVPGTFVYTPATGTVLDPGSQTLSVTFTPTDTANFATATRTVNVNVVAANGDANQDGKIGIEDALLALQIAVGLVPMDAKYLAYCDVAPYVNGKPQPDRKIDVGDAIVILRKVVGTL